MHNMISRVGFLSLGCLFFCTSLRLFIQHKSKYDYLSKCLTTHLLYWCIWNRICTFLWNKHVKVKAALNYGLPEQSFHVTFLVVSERLCRINATWLQPCRSASVPGNKQESGDGVLSQPVEQLSIKHRHIIKGFRWSFFWPLKMASRFLGIVSIHRRTAGDDVCPRKP